VIGRTLVLAICLVVMAWGPADRPLSGYSPDLRLAASAQPPSAAGLLKLEKTIELRHGNAAAMRWHEDGRRLFLANVEGSQGLTIIDAADPRNPRWVTGTMPGGMNFVWFVAVRGRVVAARSSIGGELAFGHVDEISKMRAVGPPQGVTESRIVETDGRYVFAPHGGKPGRIQTFDTQTGKVVAQIEEVDGFEGLWASHFDHDRRLLAIGSLQKTAAGIPGGLYLYRANDNGTLTRLGKYTGESVGEIKIVGSRAFVNTGKILILDIQNPSAPTLLGSYLHRQRNEIFWMSASADGRRLYVTAQKPSPNPAEDGRPMWEAVILDTSNRSNLTLLGSRDWGRFEPFRPEAIAKHPTKPIVAISHYNFGVSFHDVTGDRFTELGLINTAGEIRDVYITPSGRTGWAAAWTAVVQKFDLERGVHSGFARDYGGGGGWVEFRGFLLAPAHAGLTVFKADDTEFRAIAYLPTFMSGDVTKFVVEDGAPPYIYAVDGSDVVIVKITQWDPLGRNVMAEEVSRVRPRGFIKGVIRGDGNALHVLSNETGLHTYNISNRAAPMFVSLDAFNFDYNWEYHLAYSSSAKRLVAAVGSKGVRVYNTTDPLKPNLVGQITEVSATWVSIFKDKYILVSNYWYPKVPEGLLVYDLRTLRPIDRWPRDHGDPGFRFRVFGDKIYRLPLWGVEILSLP